MTTFRCFTHRNKKGILETKTINVSLSKQLRRRILNLMLQRYESWYYNPDPGDNYTDRTSNIEETEQEFRTLLGMEKLVAQNQEVGFNDFVLNGYPNHILDVIEIFNNRHAKGTEFANEINQAMLDYNCPWLLFNGIFVKVDSQFLEEHIMDRALGLMNVNNYTGALQEFLSARNHLTAGNRKEAIYESCKAYESVLKIITGKDQGNASTLIRELENTDLFKDFPLDHIKPFCEQVLMCLPTIGNRFGRHGQGADIVEVPNHVAELTVHLAGSFIVFMIMRIEIYSKVVYDRIKKVAYPYYDLLTIKT